MAISTPLIYAMLDNHQAYHQSIVVEVEDKIAKQSISILIDPGSAHSYVTPNVAKGCSFLKMKNNKS